MTPAPRALLFDMDGLLVDTEPIWHIAEQRILAGFGATWDLEFGMTMLGGPIDRAAQILCERIGWAIPAAEMESRLIATMVGLLAAEPISWLPGARELIEAATEWEIPAALVSNSYRPILDSVLIALADDLGRVPFATTVTADEVRAGKPDPEPYRVAAARLEARPEDCIVFEDSPVGTQAGLAAGAIVVAVTHADLPDHPNLRRRSSLVGVTLPLLQSFFTE